jgi:hypothetical protein
MGGPVWGGRQAAGKADSQAFRGKRLPHRWLGSWRTKPVAVAAGLFRFVRLFLHARGEWLRKPRLRLRQPPRTLLLPLPLQHWRLKTVPLNLPLQHRHPKLLP